ncbi:hypothetical protein [Acinetobacter sp. HY1485]|uniref:hypothetical protein n=1 Tax=Acinetobacter sp. HY1485 TaxID=2970918 RepID=UPI0022B97ACF|nr:hypothetical protein [Acinetobacter sp. HY1485]
MEERSFEHGRAILEDCEGKILGYLDNAINFINIVPKKQFSKIQMGEKNKNHRSLLELRFYVSQLKTYYTHQDWINHKVNKFDILDLLKKMQNILETAELSSKNQYRSLTELDLYYVLKMEDSSRYFDEEIIISFYFNNFLDIYSEVLQRDFLDSLINHSIAIEKGTSSEELQIKLTAIANKENVLREKNKLSEQKENEAISSLIRAKDFFEEAQKSAKSARELNNRKSSEYTEKSYKEAADFYLKQAKNMTKAFYAMIFLGLVVSIVLTILYPIDSEHIINPLIQKIIVASIFIILITFFLRRSTQYYRLAFQAKQTSLELEALPFFMLNVKESDQQKEIYAKLAEKYFGKELDQTQNDKIAEIVQDQAKLSVDLAKQMTEVMKDFKSVTEKPSSEGK